MLHVGQEVVCVDDVPHPTNTTGLDGLQKSNKYIIRWVGNSPPHFMAHGSAVRVEGILRPYNDHPFRATRFVPVEKQSTSAGMAVLRSILANPRQKIHDKEKV